MINRKINLIIRKLKVNPRRLTQSKINKDAYRFKYVRVKQKKKKKKKQLFSLFYSRIIILRKKDG